jgi:polysaccharide pyruvyl transferase WcaK-like protein
MAESLDEFVKLTSSAILFLTHDNRTAHSDAAFVDEIIKHLKTEIKYEFVPETVEPTDIKRLCSFSELIVTGRMHLGIAGLGTGTATMITDYQGKVSGLYELFETPNLRLDLAEIVKPKQLSKLMVEAFNVREKYKKTIAKNLPKVKNLSRKNLQSVW